ncbi:hypothetical protein [Salinimicrobium sediminilitoris]|uniref:hypothetical protein n=1 Tax=Salinimicrobium sediminilitoris TaxID=2876715 RepID=UPI001E5CB40F|nr:hypothetical protein [Salinimicrobium sediminilitoris]MCC8361006.1 hypothetical protein [Salinimicrobium sediminilitoris]
MNKNYFYLMFIALFLGCSPSETEDDQGQEPESGNPPTVEDRYLSEINGDDDVKFHYENGLLVKGVGNSSSEHSSYYVAFQIEYNSNNKVDRVLVSHYVYINKPADFSFDLTNSEYEDGLEIYNYDYKDNRLHTISGETGQVQTEIFYDNKGRVIKTKNYDEDGEYDESSLKYDSEGKLSSFDAFHTGTNKTVYGEIESDDKANPLYVFWKNHSFVMPIIYSYFLDNNVSFYPHNITAVHVQGEKQYGVKHMEYEEGYPIIYDLDVEDSATQDTEPMRLMYLD